MNRFKTLIDSQLISRRLLPLPALLLLAACSSSIQPRPVMQHHQSTIQTASIQRQPLHAIDIAMQQIGTPYRYGGSNPSGFDCSGLVYYAYRKSGRVIPRDTRGQLRHARKIRRSELRPGDLVFFRISRNKVSHVGLYIGDNRFVHAPSSGKHVQVSYMDSVYWQPRFITAGRL